MLLCIIAIAPLIVLDSFAVHDTLKNALGLSFLFISVGCGVGLFILTHLRLAPYEQTYHQRELIFQYGVDGYLQEEKKTFQCKYQLFIILGVILIAFIPFIPLFVFPAIFTPQFEGFGLGFTISIISTGIFLIIYAYTYHASFAILYQEDDYKEYQEDNKSYNMIAVIYWPVVTALYLGIIFFNSWRDSWFVWPLAGCLYFPIVIISERITKK